MGKLYAHTWTDEQVLSIFRLKTSGDEVRQYISSVLHRIHNEEVAAFNSSLSKKQIVMSGLRRSIRQAFDDTKWDDEHLALLDNALYGELKGEPSPKTIQIPKRYRHRIKNLSVERGDEVTEESVVVPENPQDLAY